MISPLFLRRPQLELIFNDFSPLNTENLLKRKPNSKVESQDWIFYFSFCFVQMPQMKQLTGLLWPKSEGTQFTMEQEALQLKPCGCRRGRGVGSSPLHILAEQETESTQEVRWGCKSRGPAPVTNFLWSSSFFQTASVAGDQMSRHTSYTTHHFGFRSEIGKSSE